MKVIGKVKDDMTDFQAKNQISLIKTIPTDSIVRYILKVLGFIVETQFIKIQYKCEICRRDISNEQICSNGCKMNNPVLNLQVLCLVQDGTSKASLELKNQRVLTAFGITPGQERMFKDYCLRNGQFMNPGGAQHASGYREVLQAFRRQESWAQMIFYCKPYAKATNDKKGQQQQVRQYGETISKPSFMLAQKEKEIFLNGELKTTRKTHGYGEQGRVIKNTVVCLKGLQVERGLNNEALRNTYALKSSL